MDDRTAEAHATVSRKATLAQEINYSRVLERDCRGTDLGFLQSKTQNAGGHAVLGSKGVLWQNHGVYLACQQQTFRSSLL